MELSPWLFFGAIVSALLHKWLPTNFIKKQLHGYSGILKAVLLGVPLPLCSCGVIPAGIGLKKDGASDGSALAFLISTPQTGVDSVLVSAAFLGWPFAILKVVAATTTGIMGGLLSETSSPSLTNTGHHHPSVPKERTWPDAWRHGVQLLRSIWGWLVVGILLSASLTTFVPTEMLTAIPSGWFSLIIALVISLPLYVCATASVPIAAALVSGGLPLNAALVFLMAGPASNMATIGAIYKTFGIRNTIIYLSTIIIGSMAFAMGFDFILESSTMMAPHQHQHATWQAPFTVLLFGSFLFFSWEDAQRFFQKPSHNSPKDSESVIWIEGLHCGGCTSKIEQTLGKIDGVEYVHVDLKTGKTIIQSSIPISYLHDPIHNLGYTYLHSFLSFEIGGIHCGSCVSKLEAKLAKLEGVEQVHVQREPDSAILSGKFSQSSVEKSVLELGYEFIKVHDNGY